MPDQSSVNTTPSRDREYPPGYGLVEPVANYRPWDVDGEFQSIYRLVRESTMVDIYRLWTLWTLARRVSSGTLLEVGSWRGGSGAILGHAAYGGPGRAAGPSQFSADRRVILADTFTGVVKASERDPYYRGGEHANTSVEQVRALLDRVGLSSVEILPGIFPEETGRSIEEEQFSLCHVDVDVYRSAMEVFRWVWPRLVPGGVVVFDDYGFYGCEGVTLCVEELAAELPDVPFVPNLSGQAIFVKVRG